MGESLEPHIFINQEKFEKMRDSLDNSINREAAGLDDLTLKKMLLTYYRSVYLKNTSVHIELTDDEVKKIDDGSIEINPFEKKSEKESEAAEKKPYLKTTGMVSLYTEYEEEETEMNCLTIDGLTTIYNEEYINQI